MLAPWNNKSILPPPMNTFRCKNKADISNIKYTTKAIITVLSNQSPLHKEAALVSRFLYKFDKKFRNDIGYRCFKKTNTALKKYLMLNLLKDVNNFVSFLPNDHDEDLYLPTRQMLEYILVRIISFTKLMLRIVVCSKQAAIFYLDRIKRGESHWMCLMPYALLSRIWSMALVLVQHSCNWYNRLYPELDVLQHKGLIFLPHDYNLPKNLEEWVDFKNIHNMGLYKWTKRIKVNVESLLVEDTDGNLCDDLLEYVSQINENDEAENIDGTLSIIDTQKLQEIDATSLPYDVGVPISRNTEEKTLHLNNISINTGIKCLSKDEETDLVITSRNNLDKKEKVNDSHSVELIMNDTTLKQFIKKEEDYRNQNVNKALTGHLSFMQWQTLKTSLLNLIGNSDLPRKLQKRVLKIWKEKCLYYK